MNGDKIKRAIAHVSVFHEAWDSDAFDIHISSHDFLKSLLETNVYFSHQVLRHKDVFTLGDRSFRWEYPDNSKYAIALKSPPRTPNKKNNALGRMTIKTVETTVKTSDKITVITIVKSNADLSKSIIT